MPTFVGALRLRLSLPESGSLKEKRRSIKSVLAHLANELHVAAAEVGDLDRWQSAELAVACVANSRRHADEVTARAIELVERGWPELPITEIETDVIQAF